MLTLNMLYDYAERVPHNSGYYREQLRLRAWVGCEPTLGERYELVLSDITFGWNFPQAYARAHRPMPLFIQEQNGLLMRTFRYQTRRDTRDRALGLAHSLWVNPKQRPVLEALLLAPDAKILGLAEQFQVSSEVILLYARLFYNVRDRLRNPGFVAQLVAWNGTMDASERRLKLAACRNGVAGVKRALNLQHDSLCESPNQALQLVTQQAGQDALSGVIQGFYDPEENPALDLLKDLTQTPKNTASPPSSDALTTASLSKSTNVDERFKQHIKREFDRQTAVTMSEATGAPSPAGPNPVPNSLDQIPEWKDRAKQGGQPPAGPSGADR